MQTFSSIVKPYLKGTLLIMLTVGTFALLSSVILYMLVDVGFSDRYAENLFTASLFKSEIKSKSVYIFIGLGVVAFLGALGFSVYFSHKTTGPLVRMRYFSRDMAEGRYDMKFVFREGDAVHPLAHSADQCAAWYKGKHEDILRATDELEESIRLLGEAVSAGDNEKVSSQSAKLDLGAHELEKIVSKIKV